jgi:hypothetical protein
MSFTVPLGTIEVRQYLGQRPRRHSRPASADGVLYPTTGPRHRYRNILFVEKEGFDELFKVVQLAERYDLAIMSTKGMSVGSDRARRLVDVAAEDGALQADQAAQDLRPDLGALHRAATRSSVAWIARRSSASAAITAGGGGGAELRNARAAVISANSAARRARNAARRRASLLCDLAMRFRLLFGGYIAPRGIRPIAGRRAREGGASFPRTSVTGPGHLSVGEANGAEFCRPF